MQNKIIIGLTGGIGSGKSQLCKMLGDRGACIVDADSVAKTNLIEQATIEKLVKAFGTDILDEFGNIINSRLKAVAFDNLQNLNTLNSIMWPTAMDKIKHIISQKDGIVVLECALLYESGLDFLVDKSIALCCNVETRRQRTTLRDGTSKYFDFVVNAQWTDQQRASRVDMTIYNDGTMQDLEKQADCIISATAVWWRR